MICPFKNCGSKENIPQFSTASEHLVLVMDTHGIVHVHGSFNNEYAMRKMTDALINEMRKQGIIYTTPIVQPDRE